MNKLKNKNVISKEYSFKPMSGEDKVKGLVYLETKIINIKKKTRFFVIEKENFRYDLLIGLDSIRDFRLCQNEKLQIF